MLNVCSRWHAAGFRGRLKKSEHLCSIAEVKETVDKFSCHRAHFFPLISTAQSLERVSAPAVW